MADYISEALVRRLPVYYRYLQELDAAGVAQISSQELGEKIGFTPSQIRQDINSFGGGGKQGYGYDVAGLLEIVQELLDMNREHRMAIIGAGRVGRAIADYRNFRLGGFRTVGMFDIEPVQDCGKGIKVWSIDELEKRLPRMDVSIVVLAVPGPAAQEILDRVYKLGIRGFWNFAPVDLKYPPDAIVVSVHLSDSLSVLSYRLKQMEKS